MKNLSEMQRLPHSQPRCWWSVDDQRFWPDLAPPGMSYHIIDEDAEEMDGPSMCLSLFCFGDILC